MYEVQSSEETYIDTIHLEQTTEPPPYQEDPVPIPPRNTPPEETPRPMDAFPSYIRIGFLVALFALLFHWWYGLPGEVIDNINIICLWLENQAMRGSIDGELSEKLKLLCKHKHMFNSSTLSFVIAIVSIVGFVEGILPIILRDWRIYWRWLKDRFGNP